MLDTADRLRPSEAAMSATRAYPFWSTNSWMRSKWSSVDSERFGVARFALRHLALTGAYLPERAHDGQPFSAAHSDWAGMNGGIGQSSVSAMARSSSASIS